MGFDAFFIRFIIILSSVADCQLELKTGWDI